MFTKKMLPAHKSLKGSMTIGEIGEALFTMNNVSNTKAAGRLTGLAYLVMIVFSAGGYATMTWLLAGDPQIVLGRLADNHALFSLACAAMAIGFAGGVAN